MNKNKDIFDTIDEYFTKINSDELAKKINIKANSFSKTINDSLKNNGYNNFNEFVTGEIKDKKAEKPKFKTSIKRYSSRMEVIKEALHQVNYGIKYRGYYQDGHKQALSDIENLLSDYSYNLDELAEQIKTQTKEMSIQYKNNKKAYIVGYIDGLEYVEKAIIKSKAIMMERVINELK